MGSPLSPAPSGDNEAHNDGYRDENDEPIEWRQHDHDKRRLMRQHRDERRGDRASWRHGIANLPSTLSRAPGKLGCGLPSSWSATLIFWSRRRNRLRAGQLPYRLAPLKTKSGGVSV